MRHSVVDGGRGCAVLTPTPLVALCRVASTSYVPETKGLSISEVQAKLDAIRRGGVAGDTTVAESHSRLLGDPV